MENRVVVTGIGVITPIGIGKDAFWKALKEGRSGVDRITQFDTKDFPVQIAAEVKDFNAEDYLDRKEARRMDRFIQFAVASAGLSVEDSGLDLEKVDLNRVGVSVGSGIGGVKTMEDQARILMEKGPKRISPFLVPMMITNMASGCVSIAFGAKGPNTTLVTACATATHSIGDAFKILQRGDADVMFAGGAEASITPLSVAGFCAARALSTRNEDPQKASRPFDADRDGFVMGEGSAVLVMETLDHALARGANIYVEVCGFGMSGDGYHITAPDPQGGGASRCMANALADAGMEPVEINYINAHGTSTPLNDKLETMAIKKVFKEHAQKIPVNSTKSMIGHLLGASGGAELAASILCMHHSIIHPTINYENPDPECDLDYVPGSFREAEIKVCLSNSFGFGGTNASIIIKRFED